MNECNIITCNWPNLVEVSWNSENLDSHKAWSQDDHGFKSFVKIWMISNLIFVTDYNYQVKMWFILHVFSLFTKKISALNPFYISLRY